MQSEDTISAIATPIGEGGLAVIRVSGSQAIEIAHRIFRPKSTKADSTGSSSWCKSHTAYFGEIYDHEELIDEAVLTVFRSPKSYTREDTAEFSCHGGYFLARRILNLTLHNGARLADPGEFTKRAFLNGRIDLTQAEAVSNLIGSRSELARKSSIRQLHGTLRNRVSTLRSDLISCSADIEAVIDFQEEELGARDLVRLIGRIDSITVSLNEILRLKTTSLGIRDGFRVAIIGAPNVGKSSLLNCLVGGQRAIVSPLPGTTRDTIEELVILDGVPFRLIDTAGLRKPEGEVEAAGIERTYKSMSSADVVLLLLDASRPLSTEEQKLVRDLGSMLSLVVVNKIDLPYAIPNDLPTTPSACRVSAKTSDGIANLRVTLRKLVSDGFDLSSATDFLINVRHENTLTRSLEHIKKAKVSLENGRYPDMIASDLRLAVQALGEIIGVTTTDDLLDDVFGSFCIGK